MTLTTSNTATAHPPRRRLSSRRGSLSAPDPFALNVDAETQRATASRLTIFRAPVPPPPADNKVSRRSSWGSNHSASSVGSSGRSPGRLSFAFASFTPINKPDSGNAASTQPPAETARPTSPTAHRQPPSSSADRVGLYTGRPPSLSAQQICDLAVSSIAKSQIANPLPDRSSSAPSSGFHALGDEQYLPFLDRPSEVAALIKTAPTSKIMTLLAQTFPAEARAPYDPKTPAEVLDDDPSKWSFAHLCQYLQTTERESANDRDWVLKIRACILGHSELLWSRLKEALGVPPELEEDEDEDDDEDEAIAIGEDFYDHDREVWLEPILPGDSATCVASPMRPESPMSYSGQSVGMESIGEGTEEEETNEDGKESNTPVEEAEQRIQGLRISTPLLQYNPHARPGSLSPSGSDTVIRRSQSMSSSQDNLVLERRNDRVRALAGTGRVRRSRQQEHGTGDSLFPSSFATLTMGPSLVANNPALRAGPRRRFRPGEPLGVRHLRQSNSITAGWDTDGNDYALSLGSGSERSFAGR